MSAGLPPWPWHHSLQCSQTLDGHQHRKSFTQNSQPKIFRNRLNLAEQIGYTTHLWIHHLYYIDIFRLDPIKMISLILPGGGDVGPNVGTKPNCGGCGGGWMVPVVAGTCGMWAHWALLLPVSMAATLTGALDNNTQTLAPEWAHDSDDSDGDSGQISVAGAALHPGITLVSRGGGAPGMRREQTSKGLCYNWEAKHSWELHLIYLDTAMYFHFIVLLPLV